MSKTVKAKFEREALPRWARQDQAIVDLAERDLAFRCDVCAAKTAQMRIVLRKKAERVYNANNRVRHW